MTRFDHCLSHVLRHEGGYVDHPNDPGGATNFGITRKTLARWRKISPWWKLSKSEVRFLKMPEVSNIYRANYWRKCRAGSMPVGLDHALFDFAVNSGPTRAVAHLQRLIGTKSDGVIGPLTLTGLRQKLSSKGVGWLIVQLCNRRLRFLQHLKTFSSFGRGWTRRVANVQRVALAAAGKASPNIKQPQQRNEPMGILTGYKTYFIATAMLIAGLGQMMGVDLPGFENQAAGQLIFEAFAVLFLRRGIKNEIAQA